MTNKNEEKANEICMNIVPPYTDFIYQNYKTAMKMAEWKDEQFAKEKQALIDKACEWLSNNIEYYTDTQNDSEGNLCEVILENALIRDFRKLLKGGKE